MRIRTERRYSEKFHQYLQLSAKYLEGCKELKQNCTLQEKLDICFTKYFECY